MTQGASAYLQINEKQPVKRMNDAGGECIPTMRIFAIVSQSAHRGGSVPSLLRDDFCFLLLMGNIVLLSGWATQTRNPELEQNTHHKLNSIQYTRSMEQGATAHMKQKQNTHNKLNTIYETNEIGSDCTPDTKTENCNTPDTKTENCNKLNARDKADNG